MAEKFPQQENLPRGKGKAALFAKQHIIPRVEGCYTQGMGIMEDDESTVERKVSSPTETRWATGVRLITGLVASTLSASCSRCRATIYSGQSFLLSKVQLDSRKPVPYKQEAEVWPCSLKRLASTHYQQISLDLQYFICSFLSPTIFPQEEATM